MKGPLSFERALYDALDLVPLLVRRKLDLAGVKLSLAGWQALPLDDRRALLALPVLDDAGTRAFGDALAEASRRAGVALVPMVVEATWRAEGAEAAVRARLAGEGMALREGTWEALDDEERYVLHKLADKREPERLVAAARELGAAV